MMFTSQTRHRPQGTGHILHDITTRTASPQNPALARQHYPSEPSQTQPGWSFLRSQRWLGYYVLVIIFCIVCVWLANWQFDRRAEARAEILRIEQNYDAPAIPLEDAVTDPASFDENALKWQTATVRGEYIGDPFLARNRPGPEGLGSLLLQALRTEQGPVFIVDRGWVPVSGNEANASDAWFDRVPSAPAGPVEVDVRLRASEPQVAGRLSFGNTVTSINMPEIARIGGFDDAYTGAYGMLIRETPVAATGVLPNPPERDEGPHLSYALQWYVFILIAAFGIVYAARQEHRVLNVGSEAVLRQKRRAAARKARRGMTDAEEEDALLDK